MEEEAEVAQDREQGLDASASRARADVSAAPVAVRTAVGVAAAAGVGLCLWLDSFWERGFIYAACGLVVTLLATDEFCGIVNKPHKRLSRPLMILASGTLFLLQWAGWAFRGVFPDPWAVGVGFLCLYGCIILCIGVLRERIEATQETFALSVAGLVYVPLLMGFLTGVRMEWGVPGIVLVLAVCKGSSSAAYFAGKYAGKRKLAPRISPAKTVEGVVGAVLFGMAAAVLLSVASPRQVLPPGMSLLYGVVLVAAATFGDLAESALKRQSAVKDSGRAGNPLGGMLDMMDDVLFAAPLSFFFFRVFAG